MNLVTVNSSNLAKVGYEPETNTLRVVFLNGLTYDYDNVPASVFKFLMSAESKGIYFNKRIKNVYTYRRVF